MLRILFITLITFCFCLGIFSQQKGNSSVSSTQQVNYSDSIPYQPSQKIIDYKQDKKSKKDKKSVNDKETSEQLQPVNNVSEQSEELDEIINIPVAVFDQNGHAIKNLKKSDFRLFIDDKEQEVSDFKTVDEQELNIFLVLDTSPSTSFQTKDIRRFAAEFIIQNPQAKIQILRLADKLNVLTALTNDQKILSNAAGQLDKIEDGTSLYDTIGSELKNQTILVTGRKVIILLTDGVDTTSMKMNYETSLLEAEKHDVPVYIFYLDTFSSMKNSPMLSILQMNPNVRVPGRNLNPKVMEAEYKMGKTYLSDLAALSGGRLFDIKDISKINKETFKKLSEYFQPYYYLSLDPTKVEKTSQQRRQIKVRVNYPNMTVAAKGSYIAAKK